MTAKAHSCTCPALPDHGKVQVGLMYLVRDTAERGENQLGTEKTDQMTRKHELHVKLTRRIFVFSNGDYFRFM